MTPELCFDSSSWAKRQLKELFQKSTIKNKDKKITTVISNSAQYGLVKQSEFFDRDIANDKNIDGYYVLRKNDFVYNPRKSSIAPYGPIQRYEYGESGIVSPLYLCFSATKENSIDTTFAKYFFESPTWYSYVYSHGDTGARHDRVSIQDAVFFQMPICLPNLDEQKKIAIFFTSLDRRIDIADKKLAALQTIKKGMLQKIFSQELRFKDGHGRKFTAWKNLKIKEFAKCYAGATPSKEHEEYWENGTIPWMSSGEVNKKYIDSVNERITKCGFEASSTKMVPPNTVVMALAGQGKTRGMVALTKMELCTNQSLAAIVTDDYVCDEYIFTFLQTQYENLRHLSSGDGIRGGLNLKLISNYKVPLPSLPEQQKIAAYFTAIDDTIAAAQKKANALRTIKKGLLQKMFV